MFKLAVYRSIDGKPHCVAGAMRGEYVSIIDTSESEPDDQENIIDGFEFYKELDIDGDATCFPVGSTLIASY